MLTFSSFDSFIWRFTSAASTSFLAHVLSPINLGDLANIDKYPSLESWERNELFKLEFSSLQSTMLNAENPFIVRVIHHS